MEITPSDIKKILYEIKIMRHINIQWNSGTLQACILNIERVIKGVESGHTDRPKKKNIAS